MGMLASDPRPVVICDPEKGAKQSFKDECDINNIMRKYAVSGMITHVSENRGRFLDVSETGTYQEAIQRVRDTHKFFLGLTPELRLEFENEPARFLDFISDPANADRIVEMGLGEVVEPLEAPVEPVAPLAPVVPPVEAPVVPPVEAPEAE